MNLGKPKKVDENRWSIAWTGSEPGGVGPVVREHVRYLHHVIDDQSIQIRAGITLAALLSLPVFGTGVRTLGSALGLGRLVLPLLVLAHVPVVVALVAVWSIGCDVCRTEGEA